jgi:hypothetical protein
MTTGFARFVTARILLVTATCLMVLTWPGTAATITIAIGEGPTDSFGETQNVTQAVAGVVLVCETGVGSVPPTGPTPFLSACNPGANHGISDVLAFQVDSGLFNPPGNPVGLAYQLASDLDTDASYADTHGINLGNPSPFPLAPSPTIFINPTGVALFEVFGPSGTVEYEPGQNQPGYFIDSMGRNPVYQIGTDCSDSACGTLPGPQTPTVVFGLGGAGGGGGEFTVTTGADVIYTPEPSTLVLTVLGLLFVIGGIPIQRKFSTF